MNITLFDDTTRGNLAPLTYTRPVSEIRVGIFTIREKWEKHLDIKAGYLTEAYLQKKFPNTNSGKETVFINSKIIPDTSFVEQVKKLKQGEGLKQKQTLLAFNSGKEQFDIQAGLIKSKEYPDAISVIENTYDIFLKNGEAIKLDFELITAGRKSENLSSTNTVIGDKNLIFIEKGAKAEACIFNTNAGPVYLGKNSEVMEGSVIRGPFALCEESVVKMAAKIYGPTTIGPHCKVGGEINNSVFFGYSNKAHDGFIGNSVIGEWCNLGADTNNSNLKNNYANVKLYNYASEKHEDTGLQFCGLIMADHSKCGINTMFNTGTVVGVGANIFGGGFPPTHIPSFSWGGAESMETHQLEKMLNTAQLVFERRGLKLNDTKKDILKQVYEITSTHRK